MKNKVAKLLFVVFGLTFALGAITSCSEEDNSRENTSSTLPYLGTIKSQAVSSSAVKLSWNYSTTAYFTVFYSKTDSFSTAKEYTSGISTYSCEVDGLEEFTTYYFWVQAYYGSSKSSAARATGQRTLLKAPVAYASKKTTTSIKVTWELEDKIKEGAYVYWGLSNDISSCTNNAYFLSSTNNCVITNLTRGKTYYIFVRSVSSGITGEYTLAGIVSL